MLQEWTIQSRNHQCGKTGHPFVEGEYFHTLLFLENGAYRREDLCDDAFKERGENEPEPFSAWRAKYIPPPAVAPEAVTKQTAEDLLRHYMEEGAEEHMNLRYILALMLERKRILKEIEVKRGGDGSITRIYVHGKSGEVFIIPDPQLKLSQVAEVQMQVADLLGGSVPVKNMVPAEAASAEGTGVSESAGDSAGPVGDAVEVESDGGSGEETASPDAESAQDAGHQAGNAEPAAGNVENVAVDPDSAQVGE
jgi:hypothetical protein